MTTSASCAPYEMHGLSERCRSGPAARRGRRAPPPSAAARSRASAAATDAARAADEGVPAAGMSDAWRVTIGWPPRSVAPVMVTNGAAGGGMAGSGDAARPLPLYVDTWLGSIVAGDGAPQRNVGSVAMVGTARQANDGGRWERERVRGEEGRRKVHAATGCHWRLVRKLSVGGMRVGWKVGQGDVMARKDIGSGHAPVAYSRIPAARRGF